MIRTVAQLEQQLRYQDESRPHPNLGGSCDVELRIGDRTAEVDGLTVEYDRLTGKPIIVIRGRVE